VDRVLHGLDEVRAIPINRGPVFRPAETGANASLAVSAITTIAGGRSAIGAHCCSTSNDGTSVTMTAADSTRSAFHVGIARTEKPAARNAVS